MRNYLRDVVIGYYEQRAPYVLFYRAKGYRFYLNPSVPSLHRLVHTVRNAIKDPGHIMITTDGWHALVSPVGGFDYGPTAS